MSPQEKANELFNKMHLVDDVQGNYPMCKNTAKQCALICVDEFLSFQDNLYITEGSLAYQYWQEVKTEIEKL